MNIRLDHIESRLQTFLESSLNLLPGSRPLLLAQRMLAAIHQSVLRNSEGRWIASHTYTIMFHPNHLASLDNHPTWLASLAAALQEAGEQDGLIFLSPPVIRLAPDDTIGVDDLRVIALEAEPISETAAIPGPEPSTSTDPRPKNAFLILNGHRIFPLRMAVVNIGRRLDNQVVLDDPRVSRSHAQLRAVRGHYILFDLNSTGGTFVNGQRITQWTLKPGDVISLAGVAVIYGEDEPPEMSSHPTAELPPYPNREPSQGYRN